MASSLPGGFQASRRSGQLPRHNRPLLFNDFVPEAEGHGRQVHPRKASLPLVLPGISARWCLGQDLLNGKPDEVVTMAQCHNLGGLFLGFLGPSANFNSQVELKPWLPQPHQNWEPYVCYSGVPGTQCM